MKNIYILKIGGSVITDKQGSRLSIRKKLLEQIASSIKLAKEKNNFKLILIHGAGSFGHLLAKEYELATGTGKNEKKIKGAILSRISNQKLNGIFTQTFFSQGLNIAAVHTASVILQKNKKIEKFNLENIKQALEKNYIPVLYGDMVFDEKLGMSICSGDNIGAYLAKKLKAERIFFASDIDGVFDSDPHFNKNAKLLEEIDLKNIYKKSKLSKSHSIDTTGGLLGKVESLSELKNSKVRSVEIFNGFKPDNYEKVFLNKKFPHTTILL
jgi:isopentenyl phosphate kinase